MRKFIVWRQIRSEYGQGVWALIDDVVMLKTAFGQKATQRGGSPLKPLRESYCTNCRASSGRMLIKGISLAVSIKCAATLASRVLFSGPGGSSHALFLGGFLSASGISRRGLATTRQT